ncbi:MAG TPA: extracellular solute-binding protein [Limnochordia bacterium]
MRRTSRILSLLISLLAAAWPAHGATPITLEVWTQPGSSEESVTELLPAFKEQYPYIDVRVIPFEWQALNDKLVVGLATGVVPDMTQIEITFLGGIRDLGGDLLENLADPKYGALKYKDHIVPHKWAQGSYEGRLIAFPIDLAPTVMYVRRSVFEEAGVSADPDDISNTIRNWDDYYTLARKITRDRDGDGNQDVFMLGSADQIFNIASQQTGLPMIDAENVVHIAEKPWVEALAQAVRFRSQGLDGVERINWTWHENWIQGISVGILGTEFMGDWFAANLKEWAPDSAGDWAVAPLPGNIGVTGGGSFYAIPSQAAHKREAWLLLDFIQQHSEPFISANRIHWNFGVFDQPDPFFGGQRVMRAMAEAAQNTPILWVHGLHRRAIEVVYWDAWRALEQTMSPEEYLTSKAEQLRGIVNEYVASLKNR